jgi:hypothetical protein
MKRMMILAAALALSLAVAGCASTDGASPSTARIQTHPLEGVWEGTTADGPIRFVFSGKMAAILLKDDDDWLSMYGGEYMVDENVFVLLGYNVLAEPGIFMYQTSGNSSFFSYYDGSGHPQTVTLTKQTSTTTAVEGQWEGSYSGETILLSFIGNTAIFNIGEESESIPFSFSGGKVSFEVDGFPDFTLSGNRLIGQFDGETLTLTKKPSQNAAKPKSPLYGLWVPKGYREELGVELGVVFIVCTEDIFVPFGGPAVYTDDKIVVHIDESIIEIPWTIIDDTLYLDLSVVFDNTQVPPFAFIRVTYQEAIKRLGL